MSETEHVQPPIAVESVTPMERPREEESPTFDSGPEGLAQAAETRLADKTPDPEVISYTNSETGRPTNQNQTLSAEDAAKDLAAYRQSNADVKELHSTQATADLIDAVRNIQKNNADPNLQSPSEFNDAARQAMAEQQQAQPEQQQTPELAELAERAKAAGVDPEIVSEFEIRSPKFKQAIAAEVQQAHQAQRAYIEGLSQNAEICKAALLFDHPELKNVNGAQLPGALAMLAQTDPNKFVAIQGKLQALEALQKQSQQARAEYQRQEMREFDGKWKEFAAQEDAAFLKAVPEMADEATQRKVGDAALKTLEGVGFSRDDLKKLWNGEASVSLRDHRLQRVLISAAKWEAAQAGTKTARQNPVPGVVRPGSAGAFADEYSRNELSDLSNKLRQSGSVKDAARLIMARRANRG